MNKILKTFSRKKHQVGVVCKYSRLSTSNVTALDEPHTTLERKHTTDKSYAQNNLPYLEHPVSCSSGSASSNSSELKDKTLPPIFERLKKELKNSAAQSMKVTPRTQIRPHSNNDKIVYLTKDELETAKKQFSNRIECLLDNDEPMLPIRGPISSEISKDGGLEWLFESDITFADCSQISSNQDRYIVTRQVDGTLYHNNYFERDTINGSFFLQPNQIYPPLDFLEHDELFNSYISSTDCSIPLLLDALEQCYSTNHPIYHERHKTICKHMFNSESCIESILYSKHFINLLIRAVRNQYNDEISWLKTFLLKTQRYTLAAIVEELLLGTHPLSGQTNWVAGQIVITDCNLSNSYYGAKDQAQKHKIMVSKICNIEPHQIKHCFASGEYDLIAALHSEPLAVRLHNHGRGKVFHAENKLFNVFAVTDNTFTAPKVEHSQDVSNFGENRSIIVERMRADPQNKDLDTPRKCISQLLNKLSIHESYLILWESLGIYRESSSYRLVFKQPHHAAEALLKASSLKGKGKFYDDIFLKPEINEEMKEEKQQKLLKELEYKKSKYPGKQWMIKNSKVVSFSNSDPSKRR